MKRRSVSFIFLICLFLALVGCAGEKETDKEKDSSQRIEQLESDNKDDENVSKGRITGTELSKLPKFNSELDFEYVRDTDAQANLGAYPIEVYTEEGKYFLKHMDSAQLLMFHDNITRQDVAVCSKSNCGHSAEGCDAYFIAEDYPIQCLGYYNEFLYIPVVEEGDLYLERVSPDGSERVRICKLGGLNEETEIGEDGSTSMSVIYPTVSVHRGYAYFSDYYPGTQKVSLYRAKLDSDEEAEVIYSIAENNPVIFNIKPYGKYVLFRAGNFNDEYVDFKGLVCVYDIEKKEVSKIDASVNGDYTVENNCLFFLDLKGNVYCMNLETNDTKLFFEMKEDTSDFLMSLFGTEKGLVYQLTDWNNDGKKRQILLDYEGEKEPEYIEKQEDLLQPY